MSNLFSSLHNASAALDAFSRALASDQSNVANASTPGYAAQRATINPINVFGAGATGDLVSLTSSSDVFADAGVQAASSEASHSQTRSQHLSPVNQLFDITGSSGLLAAFQQFSTAFSNLSVTPNDSTVATRALAAAGNVANAFQSIASGLDSQRAKIDSEIQTTTSQINSLSAKIRQLNVQAISQPETDPAADANLRSSLDQLSSLIDITVTRNANGGVSVLAGGQIPLVIGDQAYQLSTDASAAPGAQISSSAGGGSPVSFSGQLGALLDTRNGTISQLLGSNGSAGSLNTLALGFASRVNALLVSGVNTSGAPGVPVFSYDLTNPANTARTLSLIPSVTADQLGIGTTGPSAQSNGIANQLAALTGSSSPADRIAGLSAEGLFGSIASSVGQQLSDAENGSVTDQTNLTTAQTHRQQTIGVSLDREAVAITAYQRAYQANSQVVAVIDKLTQVAVNLLGASG